MNKNILEVNIMFELRPIRRNYMSYNPFFDFDRAFSQFAFDSYPTPFKTDVRAEDDHYIVETDLPGFDKSDIKLDLTQDTLTISAEHTAENETKENENSYIHRERTYGAYSRSFDVSGIDTDHIEAKYENGVLTLTLPKKAEVLPETRRLEIQ